MARTDGRWLAYTSGRGGRTQVYVQPYPGLDRLVQVSTNGGLAPAWARDGRELFYLGRRGMTAVEMKINGGNIVPGKPVELFRARGISIDPVRYDMNPVRFYDVTPDGQRFVIVYQEQPEADEDPYKKHHGQMVNVVLNWAEELKQKVPTE